MTSSSTLPPLDDLLNDLHEHLKEQIDEAKSSDEERIKELKEGTKSALFALFSAVSEAPKEVLTPEARQRLDADIMDQIKSSASVLKFPLLRALQSPQHYRAFLGLPQTMEQTRRFMTQISSAKLRDILGGDNLTISDAELQQLEWIEKVLHFMTGDGRRKKDLGGFVLQDKSVVRGAINRVTQRRKELEMAARQQQQASSSTASSKKVVQYELERDVRLVDQERQQARASDFGSLIDDALLKK